MSDVLLCVGDGTGSVLVMFGSGVAECQLAMTAMGLTAASQQPLAENRNEVASIAAVAC